jgi:hypothetical protein
MASRTIQRWTSSERWPLDFWAKAIKESGPISSDQTPPETKRFEKTRWQQKMHYHSTRKTQQFTRFFRLHKSTVVVSTFATNKKNPSGKNFDTNFHRNHPANKFNHFDKPMNNCYSRKSKIFLKILRRTLLASKYLFMRWMGTADRSTGVRSTEDLPIWLQ